MTQEHVIALAMVAVRNATPKDAQVFNFSIDFLNDAPDTLVPDVKVVHHGRKTMVLDVEIKDLDETLIAKALVTMLL